MAELISVQEKSENHVVLLVSKDFVESAVRKALVEHDEKYSKDWLLNPTYNIADVLFSGTKL